jgi:acetoin utilization deacetylase AcuC-like enzyme
MSTLLISHPACLEHLTPLGHPERPDRLRAVEQALEAEKFQSLVREQAPMASLEHIALCHPMDYIEEIRDAAPNEGIVHLDADTSMSPGSFEAALRAAGGAMFAVDEVLAKKASNAFVATRPPGHHAETARPMGFCFFDNVAIAARYAQQRHGIARAAIVDFDVHHGNGSQEIFWSDKSVMYCSTHQMPLFPGTGAVIESGEHNTVVNAPLRPGDGGESFRAALETRVLPRLADFRPELIIISAGFDAHMRDPLASINLDENDFVWATQKLMDIADGCAGGRIVSVLEGGYDLRALGNSVAAHVTALMQG